MVETPTVTVMSLGNYAERLEMAIRALADSSPLFMGDHAFQFLEDRPTVGQLDKDCAVADVLSFGNDLA
jgi:hypothetical protein